MAMRSHVALGAVVAASVVLSAGCAGDDAPAAQQSESEGGTWSAEEVAEATGTRAVVPLFAVPKDLPDLQLGFANPGLSYPFFAEWSTGMHDAAEFYGVALDEVDLAFKYETAMSAYEQMSVKQPAVIGSGGGAMNAAVVAAAAANGTDAVVIDGAVDGAADFGVSDAEVGSLAITTLAEAVDAKLATDWAGKELYIAGISAANCPPCDARVRQSFADAAAAWDIPEDRQVRLEPVGTDPTNNAADTFTDFLTAHPDAATIVVSYGDAPVVGALNAAKSADRTGDILAVASGGDSAGRTALRDPDNAGVLLGAIDFQPYSAGWNWVEAAIATHLGESFDEYAVTRVLTAENVDEFYPDDDR